MTYKIIAPSYEELKNRNNIKILKNDDAFEKLLSENHFSKHITTRSYGKFRLKLFDDLNFFRK